jgi:predicted acylesterase/phospholipase RssA
MWGDTQIEDLWRPSFFVSTDLTHATQRVATRGNLAENVVGSSAMPPILPPSRLDGSLCVDGAFVNNVPIPEMKSIVRGGPVIAVDVTPSVTLNQPGDHEDDGSGKPLVGKLRSLLQLDEPGIFETLIRCQLVHHVAQMRSVQKMASLYLAPDVRRFGMMAHWRAPEIAAAGRDQSYEPLKAWWMGYARNLRIVRHSRELFEFIDFHP